MRQSQSRPSRELPVGIQEMPAEERLLVERVRTLLSEDRLPREPASHIWGGQGIGELCNICQRVISSHDAEFELVFASHAVSLRAHRQCYAVWECERRRIAQ